MAELMSVEDQSALELNQRIRKKIIKDLTKEGTTLPEDKESRDFLIKALDGSDRQVLTKAKIKSDDTNGQNQANIQAMTLNLLKQVNSRQQGGPRIESIDVPMIEVTPVDGETHIGIETFTFEDIMKPD